MKKNNSTELLIVFIICIVILNGIILSWHGFHDSRQRPQPYLVLQTNAKQDVRSVLGRGHADDNVVALTFDDGPDPRYTPRILDILEKESVRATFFVIGKNARKHPQILKRAIKMGNTIENHSWDHPQYHRLTSKQIKRQLVKTSEEIVRITGRKPVFFRPPRGAMSPKINQVVSQAGYRIAFWTDSVRASVIKEPRAEARDISRLAGNGTVILLHDGLLNREKDVKTLPYLINYLKRRGFKFVSLDYFIKNDKPEPTLVSGR